ncbi:MAG: hypothetical protein K0B85_00610 [Coriobacteriia bacterium]|nr:hypothetical protein [Coriobacteriia bacterium]
MSKSCELKAANGVLAHCDEERCVYWRVVDHLDLAAPVNGCAVQYFELLGEDGAPVASWLLSVKERVEGVEQQRDE